MKYFGTDGIRLEDMPMLKNLAIKTSYALKKLGAKKVVVGYDARPHGKEIVKALIKNLNLLGIETSFLGVVPSACVAFTNKKNKSDFGVMITASHNPRNVNGIKIFNTHGEKLSKIKENKIEELFEELPAHNIEHTLRKYAKENNINKAKNKRIKPKENIDTLVKYAPNLKGKKIVLDCSNGASKKLVKKIFSNTFGKIIYINRKAGKFINEGCGAVHPEMLKETVLKLNADLGFAFDGDADRCVAVLKDGTILSGDNSLVGIAKYYKYSKIVGTIYSNGAIENHLKNFNIQFLRSDVGDQAVKKLMNKEKCRFGGERSGHFIFSEVLPTGDGMFSALKIASIENFETLQHFEKMPSKTLNITSENKTALSKKLLGLENEYSKLLNGVGRVMIRPSGTEPTVRILIEHTSQDIINEIEKLILNNV